MSELSDDELNKEIEEAANYKKSLEKATEAQKKKQVLGIKEASENMGEDPSQVEIIEVPWYKKVGRAFNRFLYNFFTKVR